MIQTKQKSLLGQRVEYYIPPNRWSTALGEVIELVDDCTVKIRSDYDKDVVIHAADIASVIGKAAKPFECCGITVEPTYKSANGTSCYCRSLQGWEFDWGRSKQRRWSPTRVEAKRNIERYWAMTQMTKERVAKTSRYSLDDVIHHWPKDSERLIELIEECNADKVAAADEKQRAKDLKTEKWVSDFLAATDSDRFAMAAKLLNRSW